MADGGNGFLTQATTVETVLRAVYGRGQVSVERTYELPFDVPEDAELTILGAHATNHAIRDVAIISAGNGGKKVKVTGTFDLMIWLKVGTSSQVAQGTLTFSEDIPMEGLAGMTYQNETASARFQEPPQAGRVQAALREGRMVAEVPVRLSLAGEMTGDARIFIYASPSRP